MTRVGFVRNENEITSIHFPNMFPALCALAKQAKKWSGFDFFAFRNLDFRNLNGKYKPTYDDYFRPLISDQKSGPMSCTISLFFKRRNIPSAPFGKWITNTKGHR